MQTFLKAAGIALGLALAVGGGPAYAADSGAAAGQAQLDARLRYEYVDQSVAGRDTGSALTLRARLGYASPAWRDWDAYAEFEGVWALNDALDYNSTRNGAVNRGVIADPQGEELNQAWVRYRGLPDTELRYGRQRLILDNARFVGNVGWRQNEQTVTGLSLLNQSLPGMRLHYAYLDSAHTVVFSRRDLQAHLANLQQAWFEDKLRLSAYAYLLDFAAASALDSQTLGLRLASRAATLALVLEYARQSDYADSSNGGTVPDADYYLLEIGADLSGWNLTAGYEVLGGDVDPMTAPFSTPLATLHKFQGWADVFLSTPDAGVEDGYLKLAGKLGGTRLVAVYHRFLANAGGLTYGDEFDLQVSRVLMPGLSGLIKLAHYEADGFGVDTQRIWAQLDYRF